jgi:hypothetical protein
MRRCAGQDFTPDVRDATIERASSADDIALSARVNGDHDAHAHSDDDARDHDTSGDDVGEHEEVLTQSGVPTTPTAPRRRRRAIATSASSTSSARYTYGKYTTRGISHSLQVRHSRPSRRAISNALVRLAALGVRAARPPIHQLHRLIRRLSRLHLVRVLLRCTCVTSLTGLDRDRCACVGCCRQWTRVTCASRASPRRTQVSMCMQIAGTRTLCAQRV